MYAKEKNLVHSNFILELCILTGCEKYLELGIYDGTTLDIKLLTNYFNKNI